MKKAKKILFTSHTANFAKFNRQLIDDLRAQGYEVHYASAGEEEISGVDKSWKVDFARSPFQLFKHLSAYRELKKILKMEDYDLIHTHTPVGGVVTRLAAKKARQQKSMPVIYTAHGFHFYQDAPLLNWLLYYPIEKMLAKITDAIVTINHEDEALAQKKFKTGRVERIDGVGIDLAKFHPVPEATKQKLRQKHHLAKDDFVLIYVAELNKNKDQAFLLKSLAGMWDEIPQLKLLLVGSGSMEQTLKNLAKKLGWGQHVQFPGYRKDVVELYQAADVVVSASQREGFGLNVLEGMACGLPAVVRDNRGHRELVQAGRNGMRFKTGAELNAAILALYHHPEQRAIIAQTNTTGLEKFTWEAAREKYRKLYQDLLGPASK